MQRIDYGHKGHFLIVEAVPDADCKMQAVRAGISQGGPYSCWCAGGRYICFHAMGAMVYVPFDWSFDWSLCGAAMYSTRRVLSVDVQWCREREMVRTLVVRQREGARACLLTHIGVQNLEEHRRHELGPPVLAVILQRDQIGSLWKHINKIIIIIINNKEKDYYNAENNVIRINGCVHDKEKKKSFTDSKTADSKLTQPVVAPFSGASVCLCRRG